MSRDVREPLVGAGFCGLVFLVLLAAAYGSSQVRWLDAAALQGFVNLSGSTASWVTGKLAAFGNPLPVVLATVAFAAVAVARGRPRSAAVVVALVGLTSVSSQLLKPLLATARYDEPFEGVHVGAASLPSGHATAAMSLAIAAVLVVPAGARLLAGLAGAALALAVGLSVMISGWHFPSDVAAGYLLAAGWALVLVATRRAADLRWPERSVRGRLAGSLDRLAERTAPAGLALALCGAGLAALLVLPGRLGDLMSFATHHTTSLLVAPLLAAAAGALLALVAQANRAR